MAWDIGGVTLEIDEEPDSGELNVGLEYEWVIRAATGSTSRLKQRMSSHPAPSTLHAFWSEATKDSIKALVDLGDPVTVTIDSIPYYAGGVDVTILQFSAALTPAVRGLPWYDCALVWEE